MLRALNWHSCGVRISYEKVQEQLMEVTVYIDEPNTFFHDNKNLQYITLDCVERQQGQGTIMQVLVIKISLDQDLQAATNEFYQVVDNHIGIKTNLKSEVISKYEQVLQNHKLLEQNNNDSPSEIPGLV